VTHLFRGVSVDLDALNQGQLRPRGNRDSVAMTYGDDAHGMKYDGKFTHGESEDNAVRAHHLKSGLHNGCYLSFTRSWDVAVHFATCNGTCDGWIYVVDSSLLSEYGVIVREFPDPEFADEFEVSLCAADNGDLPKEIVVAKHTYRLGEPV